jgi:hypothetical protein
MSDNEKKSRLEQYDDELDDELIALSPPPPSPRFLVFTLAILILSVLMLGWFYPELRFLLAQISGPTDLGEAADIDMAELTSHSYISLDGFPLIQRTLTFKEGVKWFMLSDNTRKFFPLAGQPHIYVQWAESEAHKAYRDPETNPGVLGPPSHFKGHLVNREALGKNYQRVFVFYDCLKYHYLGRCNRCLGKGSEDACRDAFVCAENNPEKVCDELLSRSEESILEEIDAINKSGGEPQKRQSLELLRAAKQEHRLSVRAVRVEELAEQASRLEAIAREKEHPLKDEMEAARKALYHLRIRELEIRSVNALRTVAALSKEKRQQTESAMAELGKLRAEVERNTETLKTMRIFIDIGEELSRLKKRCLALKEKAVLLSPQSLADLSRFDPHSPNGANINDAIAALESAIAEVERGRNRESTTGRDDAAQESDTSGAAAVAARDGGVEDSESAPMPPLPAVTPKLQADPAYQRLMTHLDVVAGRASVLMKKIKVLLPGSIKAFDEWAKKPDVLGSIPEGLREARVVGALGKLEEMLQNAPPPAGENPLQLAVSYNDKIDKLEAAKKRIASIENMPGLNEIRIQEKIAHLKEIAEKDGKGDDGASVKAAIDDLLADMTSSGLYLTNLKGAPDEMVKLEKIFDPAVIEQFDAQLTAAAETLTSGDWVLIDGEIPLDKLWVAGVYLMLLIMIAVNLRKIWRFFLEYKA